MTRHGSVTRGVHEPRNGTPDGQPPLLRELRHVPQEDAETIRQNLKSMGWKRSEPLWGPAAEPCRVGTKKQDA